MNGAVSADFGGATVVLLESRLAAETAAMVRRLGGEPVCAPSLAEVDVPVDDDVAALVDRLTASSGSAVVFLTGVAVTRMFAAADRLRRSDALARALSRAVVVARGPKPSGALARRGVAVSRSVAEPFTTADVVAALEGVPLEEREVTLVHYGERSEPLVSYLSSRGARIHELMLYEWQLPADTGPLSRAVDAIVAGEVDVVAFTSQIQVRHLLGVAGPARRDALVHALNERVLVGAVGPTCAAACAAAGVLDVVTPIHPKLAPMLTALAHAHAARRRDSYLHSTPRSHSDD
jgi:uroporphyrinogen-III synthase